MTNKADVPPGTLDMLILRTLQFEPMHGLGISRRIEQITVGTFQLNPGTFFPALYRLEQDNLIKAEWGRSETNRPAKYYHLTAAGKRRLKEELRNWNRVLEAITRVLRGPQEQ
jgi:PadR family transcriptional regulator PadR